MQLKQFINNPFQENSYVLWDDDTHDAALIDCGAMTENERLAIECFVENHELRIIHILNTHLHLDHCFGTSWACAKYTLPLEASSDDEFLLRAIRQQAELFGLSTSYLAPDADHLTLSPIDELSSLSVGSHAIKVLATPGHTPGGLCFYLPDDALLFSGDTLFNGSVGRTDLDGGSHSQLINSIKTKISVLPDNVRVYCGHGPYTTIADEKQYNPYL